VRGEMEGREKKKGKNEDEEVRGMEA
jgi:hypothetical protein